MRREARSHSRILLLLLGVVLIASSAGWDAIAAQDAVSVPRGTSPFIRATLDRYCVSCHNERLKTGGLMLDGADPSKVSDAPELWEKVVRKLRVGAMPPLPARRPDAATYASVIASLESALDQAEHARPNPGAPPAHRLNRAEYAGAIRDLLALDVDVSSLLPPDDAAYGFDNNADALGVSPVLLERYLNAADTISALAVGDPNVGAGSETYRVRQDLSQNEHIEGLPFGTVGGVLVHHTFPLDGEYVLQARLFRTNTDAARGLEYPHQVEFIVDGERVQSVTVGGGADYRALFDDPTPASDAIDARLRVRVPVKAGPHDVAVTFVERSSAVDSRLLQPFVRSSADTFDFTGRPHISQVSVTGPFNPSGPGDTPSRRRIFVCRPSNGRVSEDACAKRILTTLAHRAYREPPGTDDISRLLAFYRRGRDRGSFDTGIEKGLQRILASPKFLVRVEHEPGEVDAGGVYRISDLELASRLSFFLWSSVPDDELLREAEQHRLSSPGVLERQTRRMLADRRADSLVTNFAGQWLELRNLRTIIPNSEDSPDFDDNLRQAFLEEANLFVGSILHEDRNVLDLMTANYTFVNGRLAKQYGIPNVYGSQFRRVTLADDARRGLLGKGAILLVTSHADRTSPVVRGKWILDNLVGTPPLPPPANVPPLDDEAGPDGKPHTLRERLEEHRANPVCAGCHKAMDPIGFSLENFDAVGAWRTREGGAPIDASGQLADGSQVNGVSTLRTALMRRPEVFVSTMTEKLLVYALGRGLDYHDMPTVRSVVRGAAAQDYRFSSLILGIVESGPFQTRRKAPAADQVQATRSGAL